MYFVYVLLSGKDTKLYIGFSDNVERRLREHEAGYVEATKYRRPLRLIYYEAYVERADAVGREKFLKSGSGHRFLKNQLKQFFSSIERPVNPAAI